MITPDQLALLRSLRANYVAALARMKAIEPTAIDPEFPECKVCVCSDEDIQALDGFNKTFRDAADDLLDAAEENIVLRSLLHRVKRVLPPSGLYSEVLDALHEGDFQP